MGLRRLRGRLDQLQGNANDTMQIAQDLLADLKDGVGVRVVPTRGFAVFATRLLRAFGEYLGAWLLFKLRSFMPMIPQSELPTLDLTWMEGQEIPMVVVIDPTVDIPKPIEPGVK